MSKLIVVIGATGTQGGSVIDTFLNEPGWKIRALTRNPDSAAAQKLKAKGVHEVAAVTLDDASSLVAAFKGAYAIFAVTDFWGIYFSPANDEKAAASGMSKNEWTGTVEEQQGKNIFDAAAQTEGLQRLIFSGLANVSKWSKGKYTHVYHFDSKARAAEYGQEKYPELWKKTSILQIGAYLSNILSYPWMRPQKNEDGVYVFAFSIPPDVKLPQIATEEDTGPLTKALLSVEPGKNLIGYRAWITMRELVDIASKVLGVKTDIAPTLAGPGGLPDELKVEMDENAKFFVEFGYEGRDDPTLVHPKDLGVEIKLPSVEEWVNKQDWSAVFN